MLLNSVGFAGNENEVDLVWFGARLRKMTDAELLRETLADSTHYRAGLPGKTQTCNPSVNGRNG